MEIIERIITYAKWFARVILIDSAFIACIIITLAVTIIICF